MKFCQKFCSQSFSYWLCTHIWILLSVGCNYVPIPEIPASGTIPCWKKALKSISTLYFIRYAHHLAVFHLLVGKSSYVADAYGFFIHNLQVSFTAPGVPFQEHDYPSAKQVTLKNMVGYDLCHTRTKHSKVWTIYSALLIYCGHFSLYISRKTSHSSPVKASMGFCLWVQIWPKFYHCNCCAVYTSVSYITMIYRESLVYHFPMYCIYSKGQLQTSPV